MTVSEVSEFPCGKLDHKRDESSKKKEHLRYPGKEIATKVSSRVIAAKVTSGEFTENQLEKYYRREPKATEDAVLSFLRDSHQPQMVVFGARAINAYLPSWLDKETKDWDIMSRGKVRELARGLECSLDKRYGGNYFAVEPAVHPGTFRIKSRITGNTVADISLMEHRILFHKIKGINYADMDFLEWEAARVLNDPDSAFRHNKDRDTLQRIVVAKRVRKRAQKKAQSDDVWSGESFPAFRELR